MRYAISSRTAQKFSGVIAVSTDAGEEDYPLAIQILERHLALFSRSNEDELKNLTFKPDIKITRPLVRGAE